jgi:hypothetical protein
MYEEAPPFRSVILFSSEDSANFAKQVLYYRTQKNILLKTNPPTNNPNGFIFLIVFGAVFIPPIYFQNNPTNVCISQWG